MEDKNRTKKQLISELEEIRQRVAVLEASKGENRPAGEYIEREMAATTAVINDMLRGEIDDVQTEKKVLNVCLAVTDSTYGMIGKINESGKFDTTNFDIQVVQDCAFPEALARELSNEMTIRGIWGWPMRHAESLICNDPERHPDRVGFPEGHATISCFLGVPLMRDNKVVGLLAVANKPGGYTEEDRAILTRLGSVISVSQQHRLAIIDAQKTREELQRLVEEQTRELREEIAGRKRIQDELIESELRYRTIADYTVDWEWWHSPSGEYIYVSPSCKRITGCDASEFYADAGLFRRIIHPDDLPVWDNHRHHSARGEGGSIIQFRIIHKDGSERCIEHVCQPVFDDKNRFIGNRGSNRDITERRRAEILLAENEERFRVASNITSDVVYERDLQTGIATFFGDIDSHLGYEPGGFPRTMEGLREHVHPEDLVWIDKLDLNTFNPGIPHSFEYRLRKCDGTYTIWLDKMVLIKTESKLKKFIGAATDITISRRAEKDLRDSEERLRLITVNSPYYIFQIDKAGNIIYSSPVIEKFTGYKPEERIGKMYTDLLAPYDVQRALSELKQVASNDKSHEYEIDLIHKDGHTINVAGSIVPYYENDELTCYFGILRDVTLLKRAEKELLESEEKMRNIFDNANDGIVLLSWDGKCTEANDSACRMLGVKNKDDVIGKTWYDCLPRYEHDRLNADIKELREKDHIGTAQYSLLRKDGSLAIVEANASALNRRNGRSEGFVALFRDISERKALEQEREKIGRLDSIGVLAGGIAHDFNNYLASVMGYISLIKKYGEPKEEASEWLEEAEDAAIKAKGLTQQLLTFSRGGSPVKKLVSLSNLIKEVTTFTLHGSTVKPVFSLPKGLWAVGADEGQISQVISNIVKNAEEAMPEGGVVEISDRNITVGDKSKLSLSKGRYVEIIITDSGIGIKQEYLTRILEPYFTTKKKGRELGLAIAYSIIKNHGGYIDIDSTVGVGSVFHIYLPASKIYLPASKKRVSKGKEEVVQPAFIGQGRILVMDDDEGIKSMLDNMLRIIGYEVELASDGAKAIERYTKARESGKPFDAVIMDLTIPGGMGGKEAIKKLLEIDPEVKAIVSSGYATDPIMAEYEKYGFSGVVTKPYSVAEFENTLRSL